MRLDHLLSKEHLAPRMACAHAGVHCFLVERWLFIQVLFFLLASTSRLRPGAERRGRGWSWVGTLLGPEEAGACAVFLLLRARFPFPRVRGWGWVAVRFLRTAQWTRASLLPHPFGGGGGSFCAFFVVRFVPSL